jgi:hypothetical protein
MHKVITSLKRGTYLKKLGLLMLTVLLVSLLTTCAAGPNSLAKTTAPDTEKTAGFWKGLWHGFISFITFIISLFNKNVNIYEVHNNGNWYNFGYILGVMCFFGGSGGAGKHAYRTSRKC